MIVMPVKKQPAEEDESVYEIVPLEPLAKMEEKQSALEKELSQVRKALKGSSGYEEAAPGEPGVMEHIIDIMKTSQDMVREASESNKQMAAKIQEAINSMNVANQDLSKKLTKMVEFFAKAAEGMEEEAEPLAPKFDQLSAAMKQLSAGVQQLVEHSSKTVELLSSIEKDLKKTGARSSAPPGMPPFPGGPVGMGRLPPPPPPGAPPSMPPGLPPPPPPQ